MRKCGKLASLRRKLGSAAFAEEVQLIPPIKSKFSTQTLPLFPAKFVLSIKKLYKKAYPKNFELLA
jgi:hypothetical protein